MVLRSGPRWTAAVRKFMFCCVAASTAMADELAALVSAPPSADGRQLHAANRAVARMIQNHLRMHAAGVKRLPGRRSRRASRLRFAGIIGREHAQERSPQSTTYRPKLVSNFKFINFQG